LYFLEKASHWLFGYDMNILLPVNFSVYLYVKVFRDFGGFQGMTMEEKVLLKKLRLLVTKKSLNLLALGGSGGMMFHIPSSFRIALLRSPSRKLSKWNPLSLAGP
jgi:hypothetical protein